MADQPKTSNEFPHEDRVLETPAEAEQQAQSDKQLHDNEKAAGVVAATGAGCLATIFSPWIAMVLAIIVFVVVWVIRHYY